jgi:hypothetical protein
MNTPNPTPPKRLLPPELERLQKIDLLLGVGTDYEPLAHLTEGQIKAIALYSSLNDHLKAGGVTEGIDPVISFLVNYKHLSPSIDRLGRQEAAGILKAAPVYHLPQVMEEEEAKKSFWEKLFGGKK